MAVLLSGIVLAIVALSAALNENVAESVTHQDVLSMPRVHAYRGWQDMGVRLQDGERVEIRASGEWLYTPDEVHGPEGHARYPAPSFYPIPYGAGGTLIGRIGESGEPFIVGRRSVQHAYESGVLYLRINDDRLGDNWGFMEVDIKVKPAEAD